jgi:hypothetical protein
VGDAEKALLAAVVVHERQLQEEIQAEIEASPHRVRPNLLEALRESRDRERAAVKQLGGVDRAGGA